MGAKRMWHHTARFTATSIIFALAGPAIASEMGDLAVTRVSQANYRHYLDDMLYAHEGDDRGFGPEHDLARDNIVELLESFGLTVTLEPFDYLGETYYNLVGTKLGTTYPNQEYIIGAHFDSADNPGADDNASGVALVLEAARVLTAYESDYTIRFIAFDREEQGLVGSAAYVADHITDDILGMISPDMIACAWGGVQQLLIRATEPLRSALVEAASTYEGGLPLEEQGGSCCSDNQSFYDAGFQASQLREISYNPFYHTPDDNVDRGFINYNLPTRITRIVVGFLVDNAAVNVVMPHGDFDGDADVDTDDSNQFDICFTGAGGGPVSPECSPGDFDGDNDVDCDDWRQFVLSWTEIEPPAYRASCPEVCTDHEYCEDGNVCTWDRCTDTFCGFMPNPYGDLDHNGGINVFDLFCILNGFGGDFSVCTFEDDDIHPCESNGSINVFDLFAVLNAFGGTDACCEG